MPTYTFEHKKTGETKTEIMSISSRDQFLADNPDWIQLIVSAAGIVGGTGDRGKPDNVFNDMLKEMKKSNPGSTINTF